MYVLFIIQALIAIVCHFTFVLSSGHPGGEIGMIPLTMMISIPIQFGISLIIYQLAKKYIKYGLRFIYFFLNYIVFQLIITIFTGSTPNDIFSPDLYGFIIRSYVLSYLIGTVLIIGISYGFKLPRMHSQ